MPSLGRCMPLQLLRQVHYLHELENAVHGFSYFFWPRKLNGLRTHEHFPTADGHSCMACLCLGANVAVRDVLVRTSLNLVKLFLLLGPVEPI